MNTSLMDKIEEAFKKIDSLSENERSVEINEQEITLGIVSGAEEELIQAAIVERASALGKSVILKSVKVETLAYAIKSINGQRIDKIDFFKTADPNTGEQINVERTIFLRNKLENWAPFLLNYLFNQYAVLIDESSKTLNPKFEIEGLKSVEEALQAEIVGQEEVLKEATAESSEEKSSSKMVFREIPDAAGGGVIDQAGR